MMATITVACFSRYIYRCVSLPVSPSGLECVLASQGNLPLHYAATYEPIFELHESQISIEKAREYRDSKEWTTARRSFILKGNDWKGLISSASPTFNIWNTCKIGYVRNLDRYSIHLYMYFMSIVVTV